MEIHFQIRPDFEHVVLASMLQHPFEKDNQPSGDTRDVRDVLVDGLFTNLHQLLFPMLQQGHRQLGGADELSPKRQVLHQYGR